MYRTNLRLILWGVLGLWAAAASAADPWQKAQIMPKSDHILLRVGREFTGDVYQIEWPATVEHIEGQWLWIADHGGHRVPPVAGWVSKDEVLNIDEAHDFYIEVLQTADAPWLHWLLGICLQHSEETEPAQVEYARCLNVSKRDGQAVCLAVEKNANLLDAAVRLERLQAATVNSVKEVTVAADLLQNLAKAAERDGVHRPYVFFEQAVALRKAFRSKLIESLRSISGIDDQTAKAKSENGGGASEAQYFFKKAEEAYNRCASPDSGYVCTGPHCFKGHLGRAGLYLDRIADLDVKAWSLIAAAANAPGSPAGANAQAPAERVDAPVPAERVDAPAPAERVDAPVPPVAKGSADAVDVATMPLDWNILDKFLSRWKPPQQKPAMEQTEAICVCLAEEVLLSHEAVDGFNAAVSGSPDQIEAYRDRAMAYLLLARSEAALRVIEETDRDLPKQLAKDYSKLFADPKLSLQRLDRALVDGHKRFIELVDKLLDAEANQAAIVAKRKDFDKAAIKGLAKAAHAPTPAPPAAQETAGANQERKQLYRAERKAEAELSQVAQALSDSYAMLSESANLRKARQSAQTACEKGNLANTESLRILAAIFVAQCNFNRAEFYQKMAATYASDDERRQVLKALDDYRNEGALVERKVKAKTTSSPPGKGDGAKETDGGQGDDDKSDD
jgi:hypothetical protein